MSRHFLVGRGGFNLFRRRDRGGTIDHPPVHMD
jgi:hypothetical protein